MMKQYLESIFALALTLFVLSTSSAWGEDVRDYIFSADATRSAGLTQAWFTQISMDPKKNKVTHVVLKDRQLFVTTDSSLLQAIDAETGVTLWQRRVGETQYHTYQPAANSRLVAVINGTTLYFFDRYNGKNLLELPLFGQPIAGPQLSERAIYIPLLSQKIFAIPLTAYEPKRSNLANALSSMDEVRKNIQFDSNVEQKIKEYANLGSTSQYLLKPIEDGEISFCPSFGISLVPPSLCSQILRDDFISWTTDTGRLLVGQFSFDLYNNKFKILYDISILPQTIYFDSKRIGNLQIAEKNNVQAQPLFVNVDISRDAQRLPEAERKGGLILIGTDVGYILAVNDITGDVRWKFTTGSPISEKITYYKDRCFVPTKEEYLYCVEMVNGDKIWKTRGICKVLAHSEKAIYALDPFGDLVVLERNSGKKIVKLALKKYKFKLINDESDRIYLATESGLVQCLRDIRLRQPEFRGLNSAEISFRLAKEMAELRGEKVPEQKAPPLGVNAVLEQAKSASDSESISPDDIFGEATGEAIQKEAPAKETPKAEKKENDDPFSDDIFN